MAGGRRRRDLTAGCSRRGARTACPAPAAPQARAARVTRAGSAGALAVHQFLEGRHSRWPLRSPSRPRWRCTLRPGAWPSGRCWRTVPAPHGRLAGRAVPEPVTGLRPAPGGRRRPVPSRPRRCRPGRAARTSPGAPCCLPARWCIALHGWRSPGRHRPGRAGRRLRAWWLAQPHRPPVFRAAAEPAGRGNYRMPVKVIARGATRGEYPKLDLGVGVEGDVTGLPR
jgi:hypothetical protein